VIGLQVKANSGAVGSEQFQTQFPTTEEAAIYAAYGAGGSAGVAVFDQHGNAYTSSGFSGLNIPVAMAWDPVDQFVLVADAGNGGSLLAFDGAGNAAKGWVSPAVPGISGVTYDADTDQIYVTTSANGGAVKAFNAKGSPIALSASAFGGLDDPVGITYNSSAKYQGGNSLPFQVDEFYIVNVPASGPAFITSYVASGQPSVVGKYTFGSNDAFGSYVPTAPASLVVNQYGVGGPGCDIAVHSGSASNILLYYDFTTGEKHLLSQDATNAGLNSPAALVANPLANYTLGQVGASQVPPISGPQPVEWYVANGSGGLVAVDGNSQQNASATFSPPAGAHNFVALTMTY
jgi:hypothetical protein